MGWGWSFGTNDFHAATRDIVLACTERMAHEPDYKGIVARLTGMVMYFTARTVVFSLEASADRAIVRASLDDRKVWKLDETTPMLQKTSRDGESDEETETEMTRAPGPWEAILEVASAPYYIGYTMESKLHVEARLAHDLGLLIAEMKAEMKKRRAGGGEGKTCGGEASTITPYEMYRVAVQASALEAYGLFWREIKRLDLERIIFAIIDRHDPGSAPSASTRRRAQHFLAVVDGMQESVLTEEEEAAAAAAAAAPPVATSAGDPAAAAGPAPEMHGAENTARR